MPPEGGANQRGGAMIEILRTNNPVDLSFAQSLLGEAGIHHFVADTNMAIVEGSLGVLPRRLLVDSERADEARGILRGVGIDVV
ncbi:MAG: DUF2007 domain-containing protein [Flavobacteriaceae bacterium]